MIICRFQKSQKRWRRNGGKTVDTHPVGNYLHAQAGNGKRKCKLQTFPSHLHADGNSWEEYLGTPDTGNISRKYGH